MTAAARRVWMTVGAVVGLAWAGVAGFAFLGGAFHPNDAGLGPVCLGPAAGTKVTGSAGAVPATPPADGQLVHEVGSPDTAGLARPPAPFDAAPKAFDIDGDGVDELVGLSNDTMVYVMSARTGRALAELPTSYPPLWHNDRLLNGVEVAVLRPGDPPSIIATDPAACVAVWRYVPHSSTSDRFTFQKIWEWRAADCFWNPGMDAKPAVADLDGDGTKEIVVQTEEVGFFALHADGTRMWGQCWAGGNSAPVVDDLDGDGKPEVVIGSDSGFISVLEGATGHPLWTFDAAKHGVTPGSLPVEPTVAELDGMPPKEILFVARNTPYADPAHWKDNHMAVFAIHQDPTTWQGEVLWMRQPEWANPMSYTRLAVADVDHDGRADIFGMDWNTIGHFPGAWQRLGPAHVFRLDSQGQDVWVREVDSWWSNKAIAVADTDGDGSVEVLAEGPDSVRDGLWRLDAASGDPVGFLALGSPPGEPAHPWKILRGPLVADLRHDGHLQLILSAVPDDPTRMDGVRGVFLVFNLGVKPSVAWAGGA